MLESLFYLFIPMLETNKIMSFKEFIKLYPEMAYILLVLLTSVVVIALIIILINILFTTRKIKKIAYYDSVTNEINFNRFLPLATRLIKGSGNNQYSVICLDIINFKVINKSYGYDFGNKILKIIASILKDTLDKDEIFTRRNADVFIILKKNNLEDTINFYENLKNRITLEVFKNYDFIKLKLHCGIYLISDKNQDTNVIIDKADYVRKSNKLNNVKDYLIYDNDVQEQIKKEKEIEDTMKYALANDEFIIYIQPKYDLFTNIIIGGEALVRWNNPRYGLTLPGEFIPFFEKNGFVTELDYYVFNKVCEQIRIWLDLGYDVKPISTNFSRLHLYFPDFISDLVEIVDRYSIPHELLEIEVTENLFFENRSELIRLIDELRKEKFLVSIDDFGAGFSSINFLKDLTIDVLKIDKTFLEKEISNKTKIIIENVVKMANDMDIKVVCEGIETVEHVDFLKSIDCPYAQGFFLSKPLPINEFERKIKK